MRAIGKDNILVVDLRNKLEVMNASVATGHQAVVPRCVVPMSAFLGVANDEDETYYYLTPHHDMDGKFIYVKGEETP